MNLVEDLFTRMVKEVVPRKRLFASPWPRLSYREAVERFGMDKPDLRYEMELIEITDVVQGSTFQPFEHSIAAGGTIRGINVKGLGSASRRQIEEFSDFVKTVGAEALFYLAWSNDGEKRSSFVKHITPETMQKIEKKFSAEPGDLLLIVAGKKDIVLDSLGQLRVILAEKLNLADPDLLAFCWVIDFPFVTWNKESNRWDPSHHLFTSPIREDIHLLESDPGQARGQQYDMVLNNNEVGGGSIRIHDRQLQEKVFELIGLESEIARERFGHMLEAFEFGTPPHGGIASGIDRLCMILADEPNIREVIAFPKNQMARDVMAGAPSTVDEEQLKELHINIDI